MRVIAGEARNKKLNTLPGNDTRPTADRVKEALFSSLHFDLPGKSVLELFAGSGQLGIEALSRGAKLAVFTEQNPRCCQIIEQNLKTTGLGARGRVIRTDALVYLGRGEGPFDFVFVDPPYACTQYGEILQALGSMVNPGGKVIVEHDRQADLPQENAFFSLQKTARYGKIYLSYYVRKEQA